MSRQQRDYYQFFESWAQTMKYLPDNLQLSLYRAITEYAFNEIEPTFSNDEQLLLAVWPPIRADIDYGRKQFSNGCKGGAPMGNKNAAKKTETQSEFTFDTPTQPTAKQPKNNPDSTQKQPKNNPKTTPNQTKPNQTTHTAPKDGVRVCEGDSYFGVYESDITAYCKKYGYGSVDPAKVLDICRGWGHVRGWKGLCESMHIEALHKVMQQPKPTPTAERKPLDKDKIDF